MNPPSEVFATIASYEDPETPSTCASLLADPGLTTRLHVVLQTDDDGLYRATRATGAEVLRIPREDARGACWPRAVSHTYHRGERWIAQFDSHMRFDPGWAATLAEQLDGLGHRAALTAYVHDFATDANHPPDHASIMDIFQWGDDGWHCRPAYYSLNDFPGGRPIPARVLSAHCLFAPALWLEEIPYDPKIYFSGEEQTLMLRAWTCGWDLFHPACNVVYHRYHKKGFKYREMISDHNPEWWKIDVVSKDRVARFYGWPRPWEQHWDGHGIVVPENPDLGVFGPGDVRTIQEFEEWAGVDIQARTHLPDAEWRQKLSDAAGWRRRLQADKAPLMDEQPAQQPDSQRKTALAQETDTWDTPNVLGPAACDHLVSAFAPVKQWDGGIADVMPCPPEMWPESLRPALTAIVEQIGAEARRAHKIADPVLVRWLPGAPAGIPPLSGDWLTLIRLSGGGRIVVPDRAVRFEAGVGRALTWPAGRLLHRVVRGPDPWYAFACGWKPG